MKRILSILTLLCISLSICAAYIEVNGIYYDKISYHNEVIVRGSNNGKYSGDIVIPDKINYKGTVYVVTTIGEGAFEKCSELTSVTIPNSVKYIEKYAFYGCNKLTSVTIPNSVETIEECAFANCKTLSSLTIGSSVYFLSTWAFYGSENLSEIISFQVTPPSLGDQPFSKSTYYDATLYVPVGCVETYKNSLWKYFYSIKEIGDSSSETTSQKLIVKFNNGSKKEYNMDDIESVDFSSE